MPPRQSLSSDDRRQASSLAAERCRCFVVVATAVAVQLIDYRIIFGPSFGGQVSFDAGGTGAFAIEPSLNSTMYIACDQSQACMTILGQDSFAKVPFQYTSDGDMHIVVYNGPNRTGTVLASVTVPLAGLDGKALVRGRTSRFHSRAPPSR